MQEWHAGNWGFQPQVQCTGNHSTIIKDVVYLTCIGARHFLGGEFTPGTEPITLDELQCSGDETRLLNCPLGRGLDFGEHDLGCNDHEQEDAGLICQPSKYRHSQNPLLIIAYIQHAIMVKLD